MRHIVWTDEAVGNLEAIFTYISAFNPVAAARLAERLIALADSLAEFSDRGRDAGGGRREMTIVRPYILRYRVEGDTVFILRIRHGAQAKEECQCRANKRRPRLRWGRSDGASGSTSSTAAADETAGIMALESCSIRQGRTDEILHFKKRKFVHAKARRTRREQGRIAF